MSRRKVIIIGAAGRDFHNFNTRYRDDESVEVVAFTAEQIPGIEGRTYPADLAGPLYPDGIAIYAEEQLPRLIDELGADECAFSYSDVNRSSARRAAAGSPSTRSAAPRRVSCTDSARSMARRWASSGPLRCARRWLSTGEKTC